jgi:hypothetical protein
VKGLEISGNFEKLIKFWWGEGGRLSGFGVWTVSPSIISNLSVNPSVSAYHEPFVFKQTVAGHD